MQEGKWTIDFLGIGAEKAVSTWIADCLKEHPQICLSEPKETHFLNDKIAYIWHRKNDNFQKGLDWYKKHFAHCKEGKLKGEFSTDYLWDEMAPGRASFLFPAVKIIVSLRNPVKRAFSQYNMYRHYFKRENRVFSTVVRDEPEYIEKGMYMQQLKRWLKYYSRNQIHIIIADDVKRNPGGVIKDLYLFLGVDHRFTPNALGRRANAANRSHFPLVSSMMGFFTRLMVSLNLSKVVSILKSFGLKKLVQKLNTGRIKSTKIDKETAEFLYTRFKEDIEELEKFLNRELTEWKYE